MPSAAFSELTLIAIEAAKNAGALLQQGFGSYFEIDSKPGMQNLVTEYDHISEKAIITTISEHFPDHAFLAEESGSTQKESSSVIWIIDPLDGTVNFAHNIPVFSVSIAACVDGKIVSGVVYHPMAQELFIAEKGKGAYLNTIPKMIQEPVLGCVKAPAVEFPQVGPYLKHKTHLRESQPRGFDAAQDRFLNHFRYKPIFVSKTSDFKNALMATGFPYDVDKDPLSCVEKFAKMQLKGVPVRRLGSAAIDLAYVAAGRWDAYWEVGLHPWDMAAGKLLVEEAGGMTSHWDGTPHEIFGYTTMLASNGQLHPAMIEHLK